MLFGFNFVVTIALAFLRIVGVVDPFYQAVAHVYVGGLFVYGWQESEVYVSSTFGRLIVSPFLVLAIGLTTVEVLVAVATRTNVFSFLF